VLSYRNFTAPLSTVGRSFVC